MKNPDDAISMASSGMASRSTEALPFVDHYLPALLARASELISSEFHVVARKHGFSVTE